MSALAAPLRRPWAPKAPAERPDRQEALLLAAGKLSAHRGYHAVSTRQIADEARVPRARVGSCHGPKHERFAAIFRPTTPTAGERLPRGTVRAKDPAARERLLRSIESGLRASVIPESARHQRSLRKPGRRTHTPPRRPS